MAAMCFVVTSVAPSNAAKARAARLVTISPRNPSTSNSEQTCEILVRYSSEGIFTSFSTF